MPVTEVGVARGDSVDGGGGEPIGGVVAEGIATGGGLVAVGVGRRSSRRSRPAR